MQSSDEVRALQRIVIFEGPDGCGKTNMAAELSRMTSIPTFKNRGEWDNFEKPDDYFVKCMRFGDFGYFSQFLKQTGTSVILDRSWPSEAVYSRVLGRKTDHGVIDALDDIYSLMGTKIVIATRSCYDEVIDQFASIDADVLKRLHDEYLEFAAWTKCDSLVLNVDDEDLGREMAQIMAFMEMV